MRKYKLQSAPLKSSIQNATWHHPCMNWLRINLTFTMLFCQPLDSMRDTAHKEACLPKQEEAFSLWLPPGNGGTTGNPTDGHAVELESALLLCPSLLQTFDRKSGTEIRAATSNCSRAASGSHVANPVFVTAIQHLPQGNARRGGRLRDHLWLQIEFEENKRPNETAGVVPPCC